MFFYLIKDKMDAIMCATMGNNLVELRHYYSRDHNMDRQNLVRKKIIYNSPALSGVKLLSRHMKIIIGT